MKELKALLANSKEYKRYRAIIDDLDTSLSVEGIQQEVDLIITSRKLSVKSVSFKSIGVNKLTEISWNEVSHRARLSELLVQMNRHSNMLESLLDGIRNYISSTFIEELRINWKTQAERNSVLDSVLAKGYTLLSTVSGLSEEISLIIEDIDKSSYSLNRVANLLELTLRRESIVKVNV